LNAREMRHAAAVSCRRRIDAMRHESGATIESQFEAVLADRGIADADFGTAWGI
jgi:hypothetical protein